MHPVGLLQTAATMISARRRARAAGRQPAEHSQQQPSPSLGHALVSRCQAAAKEFADNAVRAGEQLAAVAAGAAAAVADSRCQRQQQPQLLLASLTSSALNKQQQQQQQPRAVLPDRRRGRWQLNPVVGEVAEGGSGGVDDGKGLLAAADENERFLVSEVSACRRSSFLVWILPWHILAGAGTAGVPSPGHLASLAHSLLLQLYVAG